MMYQTYPWKYLITILPSKATFKPTTPNENISKSHTSFDYMVFPLDFNSHNFKVVITWEEKNFSYNGHPVNESKK